jgi:hypothetical protein
MKKYILSCMAAAVVTAAGAQIPNAGFENWTIVGSYQIPDGWGTMNHTTASNSVYTATKGTPGSPGASYLKLTSKTTGPTVTNGIAVSGVLDTVSLLPKSGFAFTQRPASFTGKWQHMIYGSSQGSVKVLTTRWNTMTNTRDTVAHAEQTLAGMAMSWANFSMSMTYIDSLNYPDSCIIVLQASGANPANSDYLWVDNLAFTGTVAIVNPVGVKETPMPSGSLSLFPNPAHEFVQVSFSLNRAQATCIELYDVTGKLVYRDKKDAMDGAMKEKIEVKDLPKGTYLVKVSGTDFAETKKIVIE